MDFERVPKQASEPGTQNSSHVAEGAETASTADEFSEITCAILWKTGLQTCPPLARQALEQPGKIDPNLMVHISHHVPGDILAKLADLFKISLPVEIKSKNKRAIKFFAETALYLS